MTALEYSEVANALRIALPEFAPAIDEYVAHNDEVLPHVLFGDLTRFVLEASRQRNDDLTRRALAFLDISLRDGDDSVQNLVAVSASKSMSRTMRESTVSTTSSFVASTSKPLISRKTKDASTPILLFPSMNGWLRTRDSNSALLRFDGGVGVIAERALSRPLDGCFEQVLVSESNTFSDFTPVEANDLVYVEVADVHYSARRSRARRYFFRTRSAAASISARRVSSPRWARNASTVISFIERSEYVACALSAT